MGTETIRLDQPFRLQVLENGREVFNQTFLEAPIYIGRNSNCQVPLLKYDWISRRHFQVSMEDGCWVVTDLNSAHGLHFNGVAYRQIYLSSGMILEVGPLQFRFEFSTLETRVQNRPLRSDELPYPRLVNTEPSRIDASLDLTQRITLPATSPNLEAGPILKSANARETLQLDRLAPHTERLPMPRLVLEAHMTWNDQVLDSKLFSARERMSVGSFPGDLYAPHLKGSFWLGYFDGQHTNIYLTKGAKGQVHRGERSASIQHLLNAGMVAKRGNAFAMTLGPADRCELELGSNVKLHLRCTPAPRQLTRQLRSQPLKTLRKSIAASGTLHLAFLMIALLLAPKPSPAPVKAPAVRTASLSAANSPGRAISSKEKPNERRPEKMPHSDLRKKRIDR